MKSKNKKYMIIAIIILGIILGIFFYNRTFTGKVILNTNQNNFCIDGDGNLNLNDQSKLRSYILILRKESYCNWSQINKFNSTHDFCSISISYNDYCLTTNIVREFYCNNDGTSNYADIACQNSCIRGQCS